MKIGLIIGSLNYSGAEKIARYLINEFHRKNHEVGIVLLSRNEPYKEFTCMKQYPILTSGNTFARVISRQRKIREIVVCENYDVVLSFGVKFNLDVMEALKNTKAKVILCERNDPVNDPHNILLRLRRKLIYPYADGFIFQTNTIADYFGNKIKEKSAIIPNFIEKKMKYLYNENAANNIVLTARLDQRQKNISMLLRVFNRFSLKEHYNLIIVGEGPDRCKFENYIHINKLETSVHLVGKQNIYDYLSIAQFFVLPSFYEGMPNSLIEALAVGLPCISTNSSGGGATYLIKNNVNGILVDSNNEDQLLEAMEKMASDSKMRLRLSKGAYKINERLEFNKIIDMWVSYIEKILGSKE